MLSPNAGVRRGRPRLRVPSDMMVKLLQTDVCRTVPQAVHRIFCSPGALRILFTVWTIILVKAIPAGLCTALWGLGEPFAPRLTFWGGGTVTRNLRAI